MLIINMKRTQGIIIVYDVTNETSFFSVGYWYDLVKDQVSPDTVILLMPNKIEIVAEHP